MWLMNIYRTGWSMLYRQLLDGPCRHLKVTGIISFTNRKKIWLGDNVLLKKGCELLASSGSTEKAIQIGDFSEIHEDWYSEHLPALFILVNIVV